MHSQSAIRNNRIKRKFEFYRFIFRKTGKAFHPVQLAKEARVENIFVVDRKWYRHKTGIGRADEVGLNLTQNYRSEIKEVFW